MPKCCCLWYFQQLLGKSGKMIMPISDFHDKRAIESERDRKTPYSWVLFSSQLIRRYFSYIINTMTFGDFWEKLLYCCHLFGVKHNTDKASDSPTRERYTLSLVRLIILACWNKYDSNWTSNQGVWELKSCRAVSTFTSSIWRNSVLFHCRKYDLCLVSRWYFFPRKILRV